MKKLLALLTILVMSPKWSFAWNPLTDIRDNWTWTLGQTAEAGTAVKLWGAGDLNSGDTASSFLAGVADYRFLKFSYGVIRNNQTNAAIGDAFKVGYKVSSFFSWFKNPPTPQMEFLKNVNLGPAYAIPLLTAPHVGVLFFDINYTFGSSPSASPAAPPAGVVSNPTTPQLARDFGLGSY